MPSHKRRPPLLKALDVVERLMKLPHSGLFNEPVDVQSLGLHDYLDVVAKPMDLGTIRKRLVEAQSANWEIGVYATPADVLEDISLIWANCIAYNCRPEDHLAASAAREMARKTQEFWRKAGLDGPVTTETPSAPVPTAAAADRKITKEADIPPEYTVTGQVDKGGGGAVASGSPVRVLDNFFVFAVENGGAALWCLDVLTRALGIPSDGGLPTALFAQGTLSAQSPCRASLPGLEVNVGPIVDWCVLTDSQADAAVCIQTRHAWYRLGRAAADYEQLFTMPLLLARLSRHTIRQLTFMPTLGLRELLVLACKDLLVSDGYNASLVRYVQLALPMLARILEGWASEAGGLPADVAAAQAWTLHGIETSPGPGGAGSGGSKLGAAASNLASTILRTISSASASEALCLEIVTSLRMISGSGGEDGGGGCGLREGLQANPGIAAAVSAAHELPEAPAEDKRKAYLESKRAYEAERRRKKQEEEDRARIARETAAAAARGAPPPPVWTLRCPVDLVPSLLAAWDFLGTFADVLALPPLPLARLDSALCPPTHAGEPSDSATLLVLRDVHCALIRLVEGKTAKGAGLPKVPVRAASHVNVLPCVGDHDWQVRLVKNLEARQFDAVVRQEAGAAEALARLRQVDYVYLGCSHRFALLNVLVSVVLQCDALRNEISRRVDDYHALRCTDRTEGGGSKKVKKGSAKAGAAAPHGTSRDSGDGEAAEGGVGEDGAAPAPAGPEEEEEEEGERKDRDEEMAGVEAEDDEGHNEEGEVEEGSEGATESRDVSMDPALDAWWAFYYYARFGLQRCLGTDALGRRLWLLAGRSGAFQVIVQPQPEGRGLEASAATDAAAEPEAGGDAAGAAAAVPSGAAAWGWYGPSDVFGFVAWLQAGGLAVEAELLQTMLRMPMAMPEAPQAAHEWREMAVAADVAALDGKLPDGYRGLVAPPLPGALLQPFCIPRKSATALPATVRALHAALLALCFWQRGHAEAAPETHARLVSRLEALHGPDFRAATDVAAEARSVQGLRAQVLAIADFLVDHGCMLPHWGTEEAERWRAELQTATELAGVTLAASALCTNVDMQRADTLHRGSFHSFIATQHIPLIFPVAGEHVCVLRSGVLYHAERLRDLLHSRSTQPASASATGAAPAADSVPLHQAGGVQAAHAVQPDALGAAAGDSQHLDALTRILAGDSQAGEYSQAGLAAAAPMTEQQQEWLKDLDWVEGQVQALAAVERMLVCAVVYAAPEAPPPVQSGVPLVLRPPTAWMLLKPQPAADGTARPPIVVPIHADAALPDFVVKTAVFERSATVNFSAGDRFRMQFGGRKGSWHRGVIESVRGEGGAGGEEDPWEALQVRWDDGGAFNALPRVSMWEIEKDMHSTEAKAAEEKSLLQREFRAARSGKRQDGSRADSPPLTDSLQPCTRTASAHAGAAGGERVPDVHAHQSTELLKRREAVHLLPPKEDDPFSPYANRALPEGVLELVPSGDAFKRMLLNFHLARGNIKFKLPALGGEELELHALFLEVLKRGGCKAVTDHRLWRDVVKLLDMDKTAGTAASFNVRKAYERAVRCFELYVRSGAFSRDAASGQLPPDDGLLDHRLQVTRWLLHGRGEPEYATFIAFPDHQWMYPEAASADPSEQPGLAGSGDDGDGSSDRTETASLCSDATDATNTAASSQPAAEEAAGVSGEAAGSTQDTHRSTARPEPAGVEEGGAHAAGAGDAADELDPSTTGRSAREARAQRFALQRARAISASQAATSTTPSRKRHKSDPEKAGGDSTQPLKKQALARAASTAPSSPQVCTREASGVDRASRDMRSGSAARRRAGVAAGEAAEAGPPADMAGAGDRSVATGGSGEARASVASVEAAACMDEGEGRVQEGGRRAVSVGPSVTEAGSAEGAGVATDEAGTRDEQGCEESGGGEAAAASGLSGACEAVEFSSCEGDAGRETAAGESEEQEEVYEAAGADPDPPCQDPQALVGRRVWRKWEGHGWYEAEVDSYVPEEHTHKLVFQRGSQNELVEYMHLLKPPVQLSWRDPNQRVLSRRASRSSTAAA